jgi:hypothetical protein
MAMTLEQDEAVSPHPGARAVALGIWAFVLAILLAPAIVAWAIRAAAFAFSCAPSAVSCLRAPYAALMGATFKGLLDLAWMVGAMPPLTLGLASFAALAAVFAVRPVLAALTMLLAPLAALLLPIALVGQTTYTGCPVNEAGAGDCVLWGQNMGATFHMAATAPELISGYMPFAVAGGLVAGLLGWIAHYGVRQMHGR